MHCTSTRFQSYCTEKHRKKGNENKTIYFGKISKEKIEETSIVFQQHLI